MTFTSASKMTIDNVCLCQAGSTLVFVGFVVMISPGVEEDEVDSDELQTKIRIVLVDSASRRVCFEFNNA